MSVEAHARIRSFCDHAFLLIDADGSKFVDLQQSKTALLFVFAQMKGELPQPYEYWYELVFRNFDSDRDGLIHLNDFYEIVIQYYDHYQAKQEQRRASNTEVATPPLTTVSDQASQQSSTVPVAMINYGNSVVNHLPSKPAVLVANPFPEYSGQLSIFDDYEFFDKAGQGSFGKVMVVRHRMTKQVRACKAVAVRENQADFIRTEINFLKSFDHPNILKLFDTYFDGTNMYLISELCEGGSLLDRLNTHYDSTSSKPIPEGLVALIMQQTLAALSVCHARHVIHRDVKPDNILFVNRSKESPLKLIDFGLATTREAAIESAKEIKVKRKKTTTSCISCYSNYYSKRKIMPRAGTLNFFSPEMINGYYGEPTDVFSAGIVMYLLLTGVHPFYTPGVDDENAVKRRITKRDVEFPSSMWSAISADAKDLTRKLLVRDPKRRITAADALKHRWFKDPLKPTLHGNAGFQASAALTQSTFEGLRDFNKLTRLKQIMLRSLARELTDIQVADLRKKFLSIDKSGDGVITKDELVTAIRSGGRSGGTAEEVFASKGTSIGYNEFLAALSERKVKYSKAQLRDCYRRIDPAASGSMAGLIRVIKKSGADDVNSVLIEAGLEPTGIFTFEAFCDIVSHGHSVRT